MEISCNLQIFLLKYSKYSHCFFVANIKAQRNLWFVGDAFLNEIFDEFTMMRDRAVADKKPIPYLFDHYNVDRFTPGQIQRMCTSPMARILNCLIEPINNLHMLLRFIVIIPDWDIVKVINYQDYGVSRIIGACIEWLVREVDRAVTAKKEVLKKKTGWSYQPI